MTRLVLQGLRGGVGCTSLLAALGYALRQLGERVLLVDLCPDNLLRLHFNLPFADPAGWATGQPWETALYEIFEGLYLLPYGETCHLAGEFPDKAIQSGLAGQVDWLLFDLPEKTAARHFQADLRLAVAMADAGCHALLYQQGLAGSQLLVVNQFDPASTLQRDVLAFWHSAFDPHLPLQVVHRDEAVPEALACKAPAGHHAPDSLAVQDIQTLATRCLMRRKNA